VAKVRPSVGTREFAEAVVARIGKEPDSLPPVRYAKSAPKTAAPSRPVEVGSVERRLVGADVFLYDAQKDAESLGKLLEGLAGPEFELTVITNRGVKVYPGGFPETFTTEHWRCRFEAPGGQTTPQAIRALLARLEEGGCDWIKIENLYSINGENAFSLAYGQ